MSKSSVPSTTAVALTAVFSFPRMKSHLLFLALSFLALVAAPLRATETKYLPAGTPDPIQLLAPPPLAGSPEDRQDIDATYRIYSTATPEQTARGKDEVTLTIFHFAPAIGPWFQPGKFPKTEALFAQVETEMKRVTSVAKKHWQRIRPYHIEPGLFPNAIEHEPPSDYSYPSGHSTRGTAYALLLAELFPDKREALLAKGRDTGWLRVLGGVHYPTDIYAGRVLGQALTREFLHSEVFRHDFAAVRAELAAAGGL